MVGRLLAVVEVEDCKVRDSDLAVVAIPPPPTAILPGKTTHLCTGKIKPRKVSE